MSDTVTVTLEKGSSRKAIYTKGVKIYARNGKIVVSNGTKNRPKKYHRKQKLFGIF